MSGLKEQWGAAPLWQRVLIVLILPMVIIGAVWFYVIKPDMETRNRLLSQRTQLKQDIERYKKMIKPKVLDTLRKQLEELNKEEERKRMELEKIVGEIPTYEEIERVFGEINSIALSKNLIITKLSLSQPKTQNLQLVEKEGKKLVKVVTQAQPQRGQRGRRTPSKRQQVQGVPVTTMEMSMSLEGRAQDVYEFLEAIHTRGFVSYPKSVRIKPAKEGTVGADVVIDVILQR